MERKRLIFEIKRCREIIRKTEEEMQERLRRNKKWLAKLEAALNEKEEK